MKPRVQEEVVFGEDGGEPLSARRLGSTVVGAIRRMPIPLIGEQKQQRPKQIQESVEARDQALGFSHFLRREFGEHFNDRGLLFRTTHLPYQLLLEAIRDDDDHRHLTMMNMTIISEAGKTTQFELMTTDSPPGKTHSQEPLMMAAVLAPDPLHREFYEGADYTMAEEAELCHDIQRALGDLEHAFDTGDLEIYQMATDRARSYA